MLLEEDVQPPEPKRPRREPRTLIGGSLPTSSTTESEEALYNPRTATFDAPPPADEEEVLPHPQLLSVALADPWHAQLTCCFSGAYRSFPRCKACITKAGKGDVCRFKLIRIFKKGADLEYGPWFLPSSVVPPITFNCILNFDTPSIPATLTIPHRHSIQTTLADEQYILKTTANVLRQIIDTEISTLTRPSTLPAFYRPPPEDCTSHIARHLCDECLTSIFNTFYACGICSKEFCQQCFNSIPTIPSASREAAAVGGGKKKMSLFVCGKANGVDVHVQSQFLLISKLALDELKAVQKASIQVLEMCSGDPDVMLGASIPQVQPPATQDYSKDSENYLRILPDMADAEALFQERWKRGEAVVYQGGVEGISEVWSPRCFIENHGHDSARVVDCVTKNETRMQVGNFFRYFLDNTLTRSQILKLPDWPDHTDFDKKFPRHFKDFKTKVPFEKYSGFVGSRNLAARLPFHFLPPDLGPKMYNAFGSSDAGEDGYGTTPIHLDMADAVNVMMYASTLKPEDEHRPAAVWDIYSRNDSEKIREYLREYHASSTSSKLVIDDPVHDQFFYLNEAMRQELFEKKGVVGWRIFQNPGDAVFVPAGSCHQVCNYKDCVKAACDFVSPENLSACLQLTSEFRTLSKTHRRREDLLNLKSILWNVWTSCPLLTLSKETEVVEEVEGEKCV